MTVDRSALTAALEARRLADQAVTEGVNLRYVQKMREALYSAAAALESAREDADKPNLGLATTRELLAELVARTEVDGSADYRTVDST